MSGVGREWDRLEPRARRDSEEGWDLADVAHASEAERGSARVVVEAAWVTVEVDTKDAGTISAQIPRAVFAELFRRVAQR